MKDFRIAIVLCCFLLFAYDGSAQDGACACCTENHGDFDFWIGQWEVSNPDGTAAGTNRIEKIQSGCLVQEHWLSADGQMSGTSFNFYNTKSGQWEQLWVDNMGSTLKLFGNRLEDRMVLESEPFVLTDGNTFVNRITWTLMPDGRVRQLWELLQDDQVVNTLFDGLYKRSE